jgi:hypothetical protein
LTDVKVVGASLAEIAARILIIGATIDTLLAAGRQAKITTKIPRGVKVA